MDRENKITPRRVLLNISARCLLTPIYYHILLITRMLLLLYKRWWFISRLSIQFSHAPNYRVFVDVDILTVSEPPSRNTSFLNTFHTSATTDYYHSTFDTTSHFSTHISVLTQKYYPKQITTHPSIAMFVNQCGNNSTTKLAARNETRTNLISSIKEGN